MAQHERISIDPNIMMGKPCIKGTRVPIEILLRRLAAGRPVAEIAEDYGITADDVRAAQTFAAELVAELTPTAAE